MNDLPIDWTPFGGQPQYECECFCGSVFRSHCKVVSVDRGLVLVARTPCPGCGENDRIRSARGEPETMTVGRE